jgi:hypothetical protein
MKRTLLIASGLFAVLSLVHAGTARAGGCPEGNYAVKGWNPGIPTTGKESYTGTVAIKAVGEVCQLDWKIGSQIFGGVGTYDPASKMLNIAYGELKAGWFGLVFYKDAGATLNGQWVVYGDKTGKLGTEILTKQ